MDGGGCPARHYLELDPPMEQQREDTPKKARKEKKDQQKEDTPKKAARNPKTKTRKQKKDKGQAAKGKKPSTSTELKGTRVYPTLYSHEVGSLAYQLFPTGYNDIDDLCAPDKRMSLNGCNFVLQGCQGDIRDSISFVKKGCFHSICSTCEKKLPPVLLYCCDHTISYIYIYIYIYIYTIYMYIISIYILYPYVYHII